MKLYPMQVLTRVGRQDGQVPEPVYLAAYEVYAHIHGPQPAMLDLQRGCRGGFSVGELLGFLYARSFPRAEWATRVDEAFRGMTTKL